MNIKLFITGFFFLSITLIPTFAEGGQQEPIAIGGVLDLGGSDLTYGDPVRLYGEWLFSWQEFVSPDEPMPPGNTVIISIPSYWDNLNRDGSPLPKHGWATYRLKIILPETTRPLALNYKYIFTAYELYINDELADSGGTPGTGKSLSRPGFKQEIITFMPDKKEVVLTLHVSNFHLNKGGIWEDIVIGSADSVIKAANTRLAVEIFLISSIFIMGIYHFGIFFYRHKDRTALYFGIFCMLIAVRALATGEIFITKIFPEIPWNLLIKLEYGCFYAAVPIFVMYIDSIFSKSIPKPLLRAIQLFAGLFTAAVIVLPPLFFNRTLIVYQLFTALAAGYIIFLLIQAAVRKRDNSLILLFGFIAMFIAFLNDVLHANEIIHTGLFLPAGLFVFIFSQAVLILNRTNITYKTIESQSLQLQNSYQLLERSRRGTILGLAKLAEYRDEDTGTHLERMREYCRMLAVRLSENVSYSGYITDKYVDDIYQSSILHDIGKVAVPDAVLLKKGKLDEAEFDIIKLHTTIGGDALLNIESRTDMKSFLTLGKEIAWCHHEKWDGSGYPKGLSGMEIPLSARITAVADVYDALTSERPYKAAFPHEKAREIILAGRGTHFDPEIVDVFMELEQEIDRVRAELAEI